MTKLIKPIVFMLFSSILTTAIYFQTTSYLNVDSSFFLIAAKRLLAGGDYLHDFFETNPPLIILYHIPTWCISSLLQIKPYTAANIQNFTLTLLVLSVVYHLLYQLYSKRAGFLALLFVWISYIFLIVPQGEFGQRDHLIFMASLSYVLLITTRIKNIPQKRWLAGLVGCIAGFSLSLKPQFFLIPILLEMMTYALSEKGKYQPLRLENILPILILTIYGIIVWLFFPTYTNNILPFILAYYNQHAHDSILTNMKCMPLAATYLALLLQGTTLFKGRYRIELMLLTVTTLVFLMLVLLKGEFWYYRLLPAYAFGLILLAYYFLQQCQLLNSSDSPSLYIKALVGFFSLFFFLGYSILYSHHYLHVNVPYYTRVINYIKQHHISSIAEFNNQTLLSATYALYADIPYGSRFPMYWMLPGIINASHASPLNQVAKKQRYSNDEKLIRKYALEDLKHYKPDMILIRKTTENTHFKNQRFDALEFFCRDKSFKEEWQEHYKLHQKVESGARIYTRDPS